MKKRSLVIGGLVLACLVGGGVVLVNVLEQRTEKQVHEVLATAFTTAESVRYSLWGNRLDVNGIKFEFDFSGQKWKGMVDNVSLMGFDPDSLNAEATNLPRVAETLLMSGVAWESSTGDPKSAVYTSVTTTMQEVRMEDWYQNLGRLLEQEWASEAFWAEAYRYKLAMASYKNYETKMGMHDAEPLTERIAIGGLLGPVDGSAPSTDANLGGRQFSFFANGIDFDMPDMAKLSMTRVEMRDIVMPAPADMAALIILNQKMVERPDDEAIGMELLTRIGTAYEKVSPCRTMLLQNLAVNIMAEDFPTIRLQELEQTLEIGAATRLGVRLAGLNIGVKKEQLADFAPLDAFFPKVETEGVTTDFAVMATITPVAVGPSRLDWSTTAFGLADAKGGVDFMLEVSSLKDFFLPDMSMKKAFKFKESTLDYTDNGLVAAVVAVYGKDVGISAQEAQQALLAQAPMVLGVAGPLGAPLLEALTTMLETPGTMAASLTLANALTLEQTLLAMLLEPQSIILKAHADPGKPFVDWLPASLK